LGAGNKITTSSEASLKRAFHNHNTLKRIALQGILYDLVYLTLICLNFCLSSDNPIAPSDLLTSNGDFTPPQSNQVEVDIDNRAWLALAWGLKSIAITQASVIALMEKTFKELTKSQINLALVHRPYTQGPILPEVETFMNNEVGRDVFLLNLFQKHPFFFQNTVTSYARAWTGTLIHTLVNKVLCTRAADFE